jgi:uncharacterized protein (UPF0262 family)
MPDHTTVAHADRIGEVILEGAPLSTFSPALEADRAQAIADLNADNCFSVTGLRFAGHAGGPYNLRLSIQQGRLVFDVRAADTARVGIIALALGPFRRLIKDYQLLVDSHVKAVEEGREARIQAIDMGRRGLHNEGAELLLTRLKGKIGLDFATARRLFTLVCVLHHRI